MRMYITIAGIIVFLIGSTVIVYNGRPIMNITPPSGVTTTGTPSGSGATYRMADVQAHNTPGSCWSAINGSVYDLTTWISRHPGGSEAIMMLCGADGSDLFNGQHSRSRRAQSALILLKIGSLQ